MYVKPHEAAKHYNVSEQALRSWANDGKIKFYTTKGGHRRYSTMPNECKNETGEKVIYTRVSSKKQQGDLDRQIEFLRSKYPNHRIVSDIGSGINFKRKGFKTILDGVFKGTVKEVVVTERDRFTRFGFDLFEWIFQEHNSQLISDKSESNTPQNELSEDLMAIITVFSSKYYGRRKYKICQKNTDISE
jgi:predicted site-specific integrase-resolvase